MGSVAGRITKVAMEVVMNWTRPRILPFIALFLLYAFTRPMQNEFLHDPIVVVVIKTSSIWYLVFYVQFIKDMGIPITSSRVKDDRSTTTTSINSLPSKTRDSIISKVYTHTSPPYTLRRNPMVFVFSGLLKSITKTSIRIKMKIMSITHGYRSTGHDNNTILYTRSKNYQSDPGDHNHGPRGNENSCNVFVVDQLGSNTCNLDYFTPKYYSNLTNDITPINNNIDKINNNNCEDNNDKNGISNDIRTNNSLDDDFDDTPNKCENDKNHDCTHSIITHTDRHPCGMTGYTETCKNDDNIKENSNNSNNNDLTHMLCTNAGNINTFKPLRTSFFPCYKNPIHNEPNREEAYKQFFTLAFVISSMGDAFMIFPSTFVAGVLSYGCAHLLSIVGFQNRFRRPRFSWLIYPYNGIGLITILVWIRSLQMAAIIFIYTFMLTTVLFFAMSSLETSPSVKTFLATIGALFYVWSDTMIAYDKWIFELPLRDTLVWSTYFFAQMNLALSV